MEDGDADFIFDPVENQQQVLAHHQYAANHYHRLESLMSAPGSFPFFLLHNIDPFVADPSEVLALFQSKDLTNFWRDKEVGCKQGEFYIPKIAVIVFACFVKDKEGEGSDEFRKGGIRIQADVQFRALLAVVCQKEDHNQQVVHHHDKGVQVLIVYHNPDQQSW